MNDAQQVQLTGGWRVLDAMTKTGRPREQYAALVLYSLGRALAQLPDSLHSQMRKRQTVFEWAMRSAGELEEILSR
jgi:hypothetical protein